jgi:hypothetical protein
MTCEDGKKSEKKRIIGSKLLLQIGNLIGPTHTTTCIFLPPYRALLFDRSLYLSQSLYVWCVVSEKKEMEEKKRQIERKKKRLVGNPMCVGASITPP